MDVKKGYHCAYQIHYHIVFPVKYRKALISDEYTQAIKKISYEIQDRYYIEMEQVGCDQDHIHLLCSAHPKYAPGQIVRIYKSITAKQMFKQYPIIRQDLWGGEFWSDGYYVGTVGERGNWDAVIKYVKEQGLEPDAIQLRFL